MGTEKKSTAKTVLLVFAILFSFVFCPIFLFLPLGGGAATGVLSCFSDKNIESIVKTSEISQTILNEGWKKAEESFDGSDLKEETLHDIFNRVITSEDIDGIIMDTWKAIESGNKVDYDLSALENRLNGEIDNILKELPEAAFDAWKGNKNSKYFTDSFLDTMSKEIEGYFEGHTYKELEEEFKNVPEEYKEYDSFESYVESEWKEIQKDLDLREYVDISDMFSDLEKEVESSVNDGIAEADLNDFLDMLHKAQKISKLLYVIIYGIILFLALLLLVLYLFSPVGFYVAGAEMLVGGIICKVFSSLHKFFMDKAIYLTVNGVSTELDTEIEKALRKTIESILLTLEKNVWNFGKISCILGITMIGIGILLHVLRKNREVTEG